MIPVEMPAEAVREFFTTLYYRQGNLMLDAAFPKMDHFLAEWHGFCSPLFVYVTDSGYVVRSDLDMRGSNQE